MSTQPKPTTELAAAPTTPAPRTRVTTQVLQKITKLQQDGALDLPADYSAGNALNSAWLALQEVQNRDGKNIVANGQPTGVVTEVSIVNALHDMVIQGLNPAKKQCYFIVYGNVLSCQRSYFGEMLLCKRILPGIEFYHDTIREGEEFSLSKLRTRRGLVTVIDVHKPGFPRSEVIVGAYCGIVSKDGIDAGADVMDMATIRKSWAQSKTYKGAESNTPHNKFPAEMALRTVIRHRTKMILNMASDAHLRNAILRQAIDATEGEIMEESAENANTQPLALDLPAGVDVATGEMAEVVTVGDESAPF